MSRTGLALTGLLVSGPLLSAQDPPFRATLRGRYTDPGRTYADVWGEAGFGYMGRFGVNGVEVIDVRDPDNIVHVRTYFTPPPNGNISAQELKSENGLLFIALDGGGPDSVNVADIRNPAFPVSLTNISVPGFLTPHNISVQDGWLYMAKGSGDGIAVVDLRDLDPDNPPAVISGADWIITGVGSVHDITVNGDLLWASDISGSHKVYDVSDVANSAPVLLGSVRGGLVHSSWATPDNAYTITADESVGGALRLFRADVDGASIELVQVDSWLNPFVGFGASANPHNPLILDNRVYVANNSGGVLCLQFDRVHEELEMVASYDTSTTNPTAASGLGCWGVYPFLGHDRILGSDRQTHFWVLDFSAIELGFLAPRPETVPVGVPFTIDVELTEIGNEELDATSVQLHTSVNGGPSQTSPLVDLGGGVWRATLPILSCGDRLDYFLTADSLDGVTYSRPGEAPGKVYTTYGVGATSVVLADDFSSDLGWSVFATDQVTGGFFERGVPVDNGYQPPFDDPTDAGDACYVTQIGSGGNDDVDNGLVAIVSPILDFAGTDGLIRYSRWLYNDDSNGTQSSPFLVELSNDGGGSWTQVSSELLSSGGWKRRTFRISDVLPPTATMQVRFRTSDDPNNTLLELGIDNFEALSFASQATAIARSGGSNPNSFAAAPLVIGSPWSATVDNGSVGQATSILFAFDGAASVPLAGGQTLLALDLFGSGELFTGAGLPPTSSSAGVDTYALNVPNDCALSGFALFAQAVQFGTPPFLLSNAQDFVLGDF